jgi:hypothetical protein
MRAWCERHDELHIGRSLTLANAIGLSPDAPPIAALAPPAALEAINFSRNRCLGDR